MLLWDVGYASRAGIVLVDNLKLYFFRGKIEVYEIVFLHKLYFLVAVSAV